MAKQSNSVPEKSSKPAASGTGGPAPTKPIRKISVPSPGGKHIGPSGAPYYEKT